MSLDVYLRMKGAPVPRAGTGVFIRDGGGNRELTALEVAERWPGSEVAEQEYETEDVFSANITHNMGRMAREAGLYEALWCAQDNGVGHAGDLIEPMEKGLALLVSDPARFRQFNPENGWGDYEALVRFAERYLAACREYPAAEVRVSR